MTTIAWDGKTLAADKQTTCAGSKFRVTQKIEAVTGGYVACAGNVAQINHFLRWYRGGRRGKAPNLEDFNAIMVVRGRVSLWEGDSEISCDANEKLAEGSGWKWALAAMDFGKTAVEAVKYASTRDNGTGCGVDFVVINRGKKRGTK
jgi:hypothetical protein